MSRQPGKGRRKRKHGASEQKATQRHDLAGEIPFRIPRSIDEGKRLIREAPEVLREKARERLEQLPEPAQTAVQVAQEAAGLLFASVRVGYRIARELLSVPAAMIRVLRHKEA